MNQDKLNALLEAEKRGIVPEDKKAALQELRNRGILPALDASPKQSEIPGAKTRQQNTKFVKSLALPQWGAFGGGIASALGAGVPTLGAGAVGGAVLGAGLGGSLGRSAEIALLNLLAKRGTQAPFKETLQSGLDAATSQMVGESIFPGLKLAAKPLAPVFNAIKSKAGNIAQGLATSSFPQPAKDIKDAVLQGTETLGQKAAAKGIFGFKRNVLKLAQSRQKDIGAQLNEVFESVSDQKINPSVVAREAEFMQKKFLRLGRKDLGDKLGEKIAEWSSQFVKGVGQAGESIDDLLTPARANEMKQHFADLAENAYKSNNPSEIAEFQAEFGKSIADNLRKQIEKVAPQSRFLNKEYDIYRKLANSLAETITQDLKRTGPKLSEMVAGGEAAAVGQAIGAPVKTTGVVAALRSFPVKTLLASKLYNFAQEPSKQAVYGLLKEPLVLNSVMKAFTANLANKKTNNLKEKL